MTEEKAYNTFVIFTLPGKCCFYPSLPLDHRGYRLINFPPFLLPLTIARRKAHTPLLAPRRCGRQ
jgi:hypothetical protein